MPRRRDLGQLLGGHGVGQRGAAGVAGHQVELGQAAGVREHGGLVLRGDVAHQVQVRAVTALLQRHAARDMLPPLLSSVSTHLMVKLPSLLAML